MPEVPFVAIRPLLRSRNLRFLHFNILEHFHELTKEEDIVEVSLVAFSFRRRACLFGQHILAHPAVLTHPVAFEIPLPNGSTQRVRESLRALEARGQPRGIRRGLWRCSFPKSALQAPRSQHLPPRGGIRAGRGYSRSWSTSVACETSQVGLLDSTSTRKLRHEGRRPRSILG